MFIALNPSSVLLRKEINYGRKIILIKQLALLSLFLIFGCVGTIEQTNIQKTKSFQAEVEMTKYSGLVSAIATSHDKVELKMKAPPGSLPEDLRFEVYINFSDTPSFVSGDSLLEISNNIFVYTIGDLNINQNYAFQVGLSDLRKTKSYSPSDEIYAQTFPFETSDFAGITSVNPLPGKAGETGVLVSWTPAQTEGSAFSVNNVDPIGYEISYAKSGLGLAVFDERTNLVGLQKITLPETLNGKINYGSEVTISNLDPGTRYSFRVRAINYGHYLDQKDQTDLNYRFEKNNIILQTSTNPTSLDFGLANKTLNLKRVSGFDALKKVEVSWDQGTGSFDHYRLYLKRLCEDGESDCVDCNLDSNRCSFLEEASCASFSTSSGVGCYEVDSKNANYTISNLDSYKSYQVLLAACNNSSCDSKEESYVALISTLPSIASFQGISRVDFARSEQELGDGYVHLIFDPVDTESGYLSGLEVWCLRDKNDPESSLVKIGQTPQVDVGDCSGLFRPERSPKLSTSGSWENLKEDWEDFDSIKVSFGIGAYDKRKTACLGVMPEIQNEDNNFYANVNSEGMLTDDARGKMIVRCPPLQGLLPNLDQFEGKNDICEEGVDPLGSKIPLSLRVSFRNPTGGIYNGFRVFIKPEDETLFNFSEAKKNAVELEPGTNCADGYCYVDLPKATLEYTFLNLSPSQRYATGVLPILTNSSEETVSFAESNSRTSICQVGVPEVEFNEWTNIISLGPKTDARFETKYEFSATKNTYDVIREYIPEQLDKYGTPIEVKNLTPKQFFDGVFNENDEDFSSNGIISLEWKDVFFIREYQEGDGHIDRSFFDVLLENDPDIFNSIKGERRFGYRVLRSSDLGVTWSDLTKPNENNETQTFKQSVPNSGLIYPCYYEEEIPEPFEQSDSTTPCLKRYLTNGYTEQTYRTVQFTDYSVMFSPSEGDIDKGRVYFYKVEMVYNGRTIPFIGDGNIIRVVLPPPNMAFAHRKMINRTVCLDLSKRGEITKLKKDPGEHYSCAYNGIGSSSLSVPWTTDNTVYDIGGDLLVDRFELGCNWTRGENQDTGVPADFSDGDIGCWGKSYESDGISTNEFHLTKRSDYNNFRRARAGDCTGSYMTRLSEGDGRRYPKKLSGPGAVGGQDFSSKPTSEEPGRNMNSYFSDSCGPESAACYKDYVPRSEFAAVLYNRSFDQGLVKSFFNYHEMKAADSGKITIENSATSMTDSKCWVNLPYKDSSNKLIPRWLMANQLLQAKDLNDIPVSDLIYRKEGEVDQQLHLGELTIDEILNHEKLFDTDLVTKPNASSGRYYGDLNLMRVVTTNASKTAPVVGFNQEESNRLCNKYIVEIVVQPNDPNSTAQNGEELLMDYPLERKTKRLPTKKEATAYSAWPDTFDYDEILKKEKRTFIDNDRRNSIVAHSTDYDSKPYQVGGCNGVSSSSDLIFSPETEGGEDVTFTFHRPAQGPLVSEENHFLTPVFPRESTSVSVFWTGSSQLDPVDYLETKKDGILNYNSEKCVSRFGIQDAIGNIKEQTIDRIFCNIDGREMYLYKPGDGAFSGENSVLIYSDYRSAMPGGLSRGQKIGKSFINIGSDTARSCEEEDPKDCDDFYKRDFLDTPILGERGIIAYVPESSSDIFCQAIGANHANQNDIVYSTADDGMINPFFDWLQSPEDRVLLGPKFSHFDFSVINDLRNGDGTFLDFGRNGALGQKEKKSSGLKKHNDLIDGSIGKYFNPVVGLPLTCSNDNGQCGGEDGSSNLFHDYLNLPVDYLGQIEDLEENQNVFPYGNATMANHGIIDMVVTTRMVSEDNEDINHIADIFPNLEGANDDRVLKGTQINVGSSFSRYNFKVSGHSFFQFIIGGGAHANSRDKKIGEDASGINSEASRFSFVMRSNTLRQQEVESNDTGVRCVVKINESN